MSTDSSQLPARTARFMPSCAVCSLQPGDPVCAACEDDFLPTQRPRCVLCALSVPRAGVVCGRCSTAPPKFHGATALGDYVSPLDGMVLALKFGARLELATVFGRLLARRAPPDADALVVPVPLAFERLSRRGFNQSLQIARAYCRASGATLADIVRRVRHAPPQQTSTLEERRRNVRGAFACSADLRDRAVLVIDDVMTSGSTMNEIAGTLAAAGARRVHALVVARTP